MTTEKEMERAAMGFLPRWPTKRCSSVDMSVPLNDTKMRNSVNPTWRRISTVMPQRRSSFFGDSSSAADSAPCR